LAGRFLASNDELLDLLNENLYRVEFNRYNLELYYAIAQLYRQNIQMLLDLDHINTALQSAQAASAKGDHKDAVGALDQALNMAENIRQQRNRTFADATATWYKSWYPRVPEGNGRKFVDSVDDVKDHLPVRTVDMTYLIYRQLLYPLGDWVREVESVRNEYATAHNMPAQSQPWNWKDTEEPATR
jgi:tetratricopeptide (TPR) repeat protein